MLPTRAPLEVTKHGVCQKLASASFCSVKSFARTSLGILRRDRGGWSRMVKDKSCYVNKRQSLHIKRPRKSFAGGFLVPTMRLPRGGQGDVVLDLAEVPLVDCA